MKKPSNPKAQSIETGWPYFYSWRAMFALFTLALVTKALANYIRISNPSGDIAIFVQLFFNTLHGQFLVSSFEGGNHLGVHFSPILILLIPIMAWLKSFPGLLLANGLCQVTALVMLHRHLAKANRGTALIITIMLMCHGTLSHDTTKSFHALSMMTLPFIGMFVAYRDRHFAAFIGWSLLLMTIRENMWLTLFGWGCVCLFTKRSPRWVVLPCCLAAFHFWLANLWAPGWFEGGIRPGLGDYFQSYGHTPAEILAHLMRDPLLPARFLFTAEKASYLLKILLPFALMLPFFRPWWLLPAAPSLAVILLSSEGRLADPMLHFSVEVVLWLALATIAFLQDHETQFASPRWRKALGVLALAYTVFLGAQCTGNLLALVEHSQSERYRAFTHIAKAIPPHARVVAPRYLANYLAWRREIYFLHEANQLELWSRADFLVLEGEALGNAPPDWQLVTEAGPFFLLAPPASRRNPDLAHPPGTPRPQPP